MAKTRLTREEFEVIIKNYKDQGRDTSDLEATLNSAYPNPVRREDRDWRRQLPLPRRVSTGPTMDELKQQAEITQGNCSICGKSGKLYSGTCEECFNSWASSVAER